MFEPPTETGVGEVHAAPRHVGHRWIDLILALTALFISGVSLYVAIQHGRIDNQMVQENARLVQANSWPFLQMEGNFSKTSASTLTLVNAGIGPAKLESLVVSYKGQPVDSLYSLLEQCCNLPADPTLRHELLPDGLSIVNSGGEVLRPGQSRTIIAIPASADKHVLSERFLAASESIAFLACYCSVFDQCWSSDLRSLHQQSLPVCSPGKHEFNQDAR